MPQGYFGLSRLPVDVQEVSVAASPSSHYSLSTQRLNGLHWQCIWNLLQQSFYNEILVNTTDRFQPRILSYYCMTVSNFLWSMGIVIVSKPHLVTQLLLSTCVPADIIPHEYSMHKHFCLTTGELEMCL